MARLSAVPAESYNLISCVGFSGVLFASKASPLLNNIKRGDYAFLLERTVENAAAE